MKKKLLSLAAVGILAVGLFTGCGSSDEKKAEDTDSKGTIKVAASETPHAEILEQAKPLLEKEGWDLKCGKYAIDFITKKTGFNLGKWIDQNIDIWNELKDYQDKLKDLRFDEENWKF